MTPQEKAIELVDKYKYLYNDNGTLYLHNSLNIAKKYALITVDEILNDDWFIPNREDLLARKEYWEEVKQEIEKL